MLPMLAALVGCAVTTTSMNGEDDAGLRQDVPADVLGSDIVDVPAVDARLDDRPPPIDVEFDDVPADVPPPDAPVACAITAPETTSACAASLCGNGRRDTCQRCGPCGGGGGGGGGPIDAGPPPPWDAGTCCESVTEACDGADLGGATCVSLGYSGGSLRCSDGCGRDTLGCDACAPTEARGRCAVAPVRSLDARDLALATNGDLIALAWVERDEHVGVAIIDRELSIVGVNPCLGFPGARRVSLTASAMGWLLAVETREGVRVAPLRADATLIAQGSSLPGAQVPILAAGPEGGALLVFYADDAAGMPSVRAARVTALGALSRTQATLFRQPTEAQYGSAVFTGDGWLVAMRVDDVEVVRVGTDLSVGPVQRPAGGETEYPQLAWDGRRTAMTFSSFGGPAISVQIVELARDGSRAGPPRTLVSPVSSTRYYNVAPLTTVGDDLAVLIGTHTGLTGHSGRIDLLRENAQPLMRLTQPYPVTRSPEQVTSYRVAPLEDTAVVAWIGVGTPRRIGLARLRP